MTKRRDFNKKSMIGTAGIAIGGMGFSRSRCGSGRILVREFCMADPGQ